MPFDKGHALVIGIGTYDNLPGLNVPITAKDAQLVAKILVDPSYCGYPATQVKLLMETNSTRAHILEELDRLAQETTADSTVFVFYAGHGEYGSDGSFYLTTHDLQMDSGKVIDGGIAERELLERIRKIPAQRALMIFNACHSGDLSPDQLGGDEAEPPHEGQSLPDEVANALLATGQGRVIITACRQEQKSYFLRKADATIFARALSDGLQGKDIVSRRQYITLFDLYEYLFTTVSTVVKERWELDQEPVLTISQGVGVMAVALHQGKQPAGALGEDDVPGMLGATGNVREVAPDESSRLLEAILKGELKFGPVTLNSTVQSGDGVNLGPSSSIGSIGGEHRTATVTGNYAEGNIDAREGISGGTFNDKTIGIANGPVTMGDTVQGDNINVGDISGSSGIAIGREASAIVGGTRAAMPEVEQLFAAIARSIAAAPQADREELEEKVGRVRKLAESSPPDTARIERVLSEVAGISPSIFAQLAAALANPVAGFPLAVRDAAARAQAKQS